MKILIVTEVFYPENFLINDFAKEMVARGHNVEVMTRQPSYPEGVVYEGYKNDDYSVEEWNGITIHRFKTIEGYKTSKIRKIWNYAHYVRVGKHLIGGLIKDVDVILVHQPGPLTLALPAVYARKKWNIPTAIWTFDIWPDAVYAYGFPKIFPITTFLNYIIRKVYCNVDKIFVSSKNFSESISSYARGQEIIYAPNWEMQSQKMKSNVILPIDKINFTFTGNISISQNLDNVIKGFKLANIENAVLNIFGNGTTLEQHIQTARNINCNNVFFHGRVPFSHIQDILSQSNYLVLPLISKSGIDKTEPFKIQSYLTSQKPILGVLQGAGREIIEEYHLGYCSNPDDIMDIALGFKRMTSLTPDEVNGIAMRAKNIMDNRYNRIKIINKIESVLKEII